MSDPVAKAQHFLTKEWAGGIAIGVLLALAVENRTGGGGGSLTRLVVKIPLIGKIVTGKSA